MEQVKPSYRETDFSSRLSDRPSIVEIISRYVNLKKSGREHTCLCPFHSEKTPSFSVNEEKGRFYCHGCHVGGDVITFVREIEHLDFNEALAFLRMSRGSISSAEITRRQVAKAASDSLALWASDVSIRISAKMREVGSHSAIAGKILRELPCADRELLRGEIEACGREWSLLEILQEDLFNPGYTLDLWRNREAIEHIAGGIA